MLNGGVVYAQVGNDYRIRNAVVTDLVGMETVQSPRTAEVQGTVLLLETHIAVKNMILQSFFHGICMDVGGINMIDVDMIHLGVGRKPQTLCIVFYHGKYDIALFKLVVEYRLEAVVLFII